MENLKLEETVQALMVLFWTTGHFSKMSEPRFVAAVKCTDSRRCVPSCRSTVEPFLMLHIINNMLGKRLIMLSPFTGTRAWGEGVGVGGDGTEP